MCKGKQPPEQAPATTGTTKRTKTTSIAPRQSSEPRGIPEPWVAHVDPSSGRTYFHNPETNETAWDIDNDGILTEADLATRVSDAEMEAMRNDPESIHYHCDLRVKRRRSRGPAQKGLL